MRITDTTACAPLLVVKASPGVPDTVKLDEKDIAPAPETFLIRRMMLPSAPEVGPVTIIAPLLEIACCGREPKLTKTPLPVSSSVDTVDPPKMGPCPDVDTNRGMSPDHVDDPPDTARPEAVAPFTFPPENVERTTTTPSKVDPVMEPPENVELPRIVTPDNVEARSVPPDIVELLITALLIVSPDVVALIIVPPEMVAPIMVTPENVPPEYVEPLIEAPLIEPPDHVDRTTLTPSRLAPEMDPPEKVELPSIVTPDSVDDRITPPETLGPMMVSPEVVALTIDPPEMVGLLIVALLMVSPEVVAPIIWPPDHVEFPTTVMLVRVCPEIAAEPDRLMVMSTMPDADRTPPTMLRSLDEKLRPGWTPTNAPLA